MTDDRTSATYWRSLERLLESPALAGAVERASTGEATEEAQVGGQASAGPIGRLEDEFPAGASMPPTGVSRRTMLGLMGASFGLAGLTACRRPVENIVPYVDAPEGMLPGIAERYATTLTLGTEAVGVVVESHEGRPTKVEGNTLHPASLGAATTWMQASVLSLYDPDRSRTVLHRKEPDGTHKAATWGDFDVFWSTVAAADKAPGGRGLAILSEGFSSPTLARLARRFAQRYPQARFAVYEPAGDETLFAGIEMATGTARRPVLHLDRAQTILSLDADPLLTETGALANGRGFARRRRPDAPGESERGMARLYAIESALSVTGANADHRLAVPSGRIGAVAAALAERLGVPMDLEHGTAEDLLGEGGDLDETVGARLALIADDLAQAGAGALVTAGRRQPPAVHALVHRINEHLGAVGTTVTLHDLADVAWGRVADLAELTAAIGAGQVDTLVILGGNPAYDAPGTLGFADALAKVPHAVHLSDRLDETSHRCAWHLPLSHTLESWGDARAADGTPSVVQPLIAPLFDSRSAIEVLAALAGETAWQGATQVQATWGVAAADGVDPAKPASPWRRLLHDGVLSEAAGLTGPAPGAAVRVRRPETIATTAAPDAPAGAQPADGGADAVELVFLVSPSVRDGRFANNAWLQELPDPLTRITWDNVALVSPGTAEARGLATGDVVRITAPQAGGGDGGDAPAIEIPVWVAPGQADGSVAIELGYGRSAAGRVGDGVGADANRVRGLGAALFAGGYRMEATGATAELAQTQEHWKMEGRDIVRETTPAGLREQVERAREEGDEQQGVQQNDDLSLWQEPDYSAGYQWGMTIDLGACIGCNACVTACQAENNVPVVGKEQVSNGREMHWVRVDRYFSGDPAAPHVAFQTVPCMHCENAPCEEVCPVGATVHDREGLNAMVYNRCIGTRYCSNNCPYKVRRFNFFNYTKDTPELVKLVMNPDVSVRSRGVMEKCTYCVQRINRGKRAAKREGRRLTDGEIVTACQQSCPAEAIVFGNVNDPDSRVSRNKRDPRGYALLGELNNQPRTTYLAAVRNPNPLWPGMQEGQQERAEEAEA